MLPAMTPPPATGPMAMPPVTLTAVLARIRAYARAMNWTPGRLAAEAGLSRGTLGRLYEADFLPSSSTIFAIERVIPADWQHGDRVPSDDAAPTSNATGSAPVRGNA